jgi:hypothetical protein
LAHGVSPPARCPTTHLVDIRDNVPRGRYCAVLGCGRNGQRGNGRSSAIATVFILAPQMGCGRRLEPCRDFHPEPWGWFVAAIRVCQKANRWTNILPSPMDCLGKACEGTRRSVARTLRRTNIRSRAGNPQAFQACTVAECLMIRSQRQC